MAWGMQCSGLTKRRSKRSLLFIPTPAFPFLYEAHLPLESLNSLPYTWVEFTFGKEMNGCVLHSHSMPFNGIRSYACKYVLPFPLLNVLVSQVELEVENLVDSFKWKWKGRWKFFLNKAPSLPLHCFSLFMFLCVKRRKEWKWKWKWKALSHFHFSTSTSTCV